MGLRVTPPPPQSNFLPAQVCVQRGGLGPGTADGGGDRCVRLGPSKRLADGETIRALLPHRHGQDVRSRGRKDGGSAGKGGGWIQNALCRGVGAGHDGPWVAERPQVWTARAVAPGDRAAPALSTLTCGGWGRGQRRGGGGGGSFWGALVPATPPTHPSTQLPPHSNENQAQARAQAQAWADTVLFRVPRGPFTAAARRGIQLLPERTPILRRLRRAIWRIVVEQGKLYPLCTVLLNGKR